MAEIEKFMNIAIGDIEKIMNIEKGDIEKIMGVEVPASMTSYQGNRGVAIGGYDYNTGNVKEIEYKAMASDGNTLDFGDITTTSLRDEAGTIGNDSRAVSMGGYNNPNHINNCDYITIASTGDGTDFGNLTVARRMTGSSGNGIRGICHTGYDGSSRLNTIDYITVGSAGDASDFGDATAVGNTGATGNAHTTRGSWWGDGYTYAVKYADYVTIASTGNASDFGDWSANITGCAAIGLIESKNVWGGGYTTGAAGTWSTMEYVNPNSTGDTTSQGDLGSAATQAAGKFTNGTRGEMWGGAYSAHDEVQKLTIASSGNAAHAGDVRDGARTYWDGWTGD